jgi:Iron-containing redox enzyme
MTLATETTPLRRLFLLNRSVPNPTVYAEIAEIEQPWIDGLLAELAAETDPVPTRADWLDLLAEQLKAEAADPGSLAYLAHSASYSEFRAFVLEFAPDGLTEAQNFFPAIARVPIKAQLALMRVLIDEFGCGNLQQSHSYLYLKLLTELGLPTELDEVLRHTSEPTFAFLNAFYWLASRAPDVEYFLGALAYLEASIPAAFSLLAEGCRRLGISNGAYYSEHVHIDAFHMKELQTAIREHEVVHGLDATKVWIGAKLLSRVLGAAVENAVERARSTVDAGR